MASWFYGKAPDLTSFVAPDPKILKLRKQIKLLRNLNKTYRNQSTLRQIRNTRLQKQVNLWRGRSNRSTRLIVSLGKKLNQVKVSRDMWKIKAVASATRIKELEKLVGDTRSVAARLRRATTRVEELEKLVERYREVL